VITQTFHMRNTLEDVDRMVMSLTAAVGGLLVQSKVMKFEICTTEVLTNIVRHARAVSKDTPVEIMLADTPDMVAISFYDPVGADAFDPRAWARDLETVDLMAENGRGLGLIMHCTDAIDYDQSEPRPRLVLSFSR
jgi:serine/threonine-protein kinase RsbW